MRRGDLSDKRVLALIPARYDSTRFPGKPLALIQGRPMIEWVYKAVEMASGFQPYLVTDDDRIESEAKELGIKVLRVNDEVSTGSERIYLAFKRHFDASDFDFVVNVQGDEPLLKPQVLEKLIASHRIHDDWDMATLVNERKSPIDGSPHVVKVAFSKKTRRCLYFSRKAIPHQKDGENWFSHVGIYSYRPEALEKFARLPSGELEKKESLEQLRALENGMAIGASITEEKFHGVDTPSDIKVVEGVLSESK